jgi:hypothetical protein
MVKTYTEQELSVLDINELDEMAFGCRDGQVIEVAPDTVKVIYECDLENVHHRFELGGTAWLVSVDLSEPISLSINDEGQFCIEDGHHRWFAALKRGEALRARIQIKANPIAFILRQQDLDRSYRPFRPKC